MLFLVVYAQARIYADTPPCRPCTWSSRFYGWYEWLHGGAGHGRSRSRARRGAGRAGLGAAGLVASLALGSFLGSRTDAALPLPDAATTAFSLVAQWMATRKWLENWLVWIVVDAVYVPMYVSQRRYLMAGLYAVFLVLATLGYRGWRSSMHEHRGAEAAR